MTTPTPPLLLAVPSADITFAVYAEPRVAEILRRITAPFYQPVNEPLGRIWTLNLVSESRIPDSGPTGGGRKGGGQNGYGPADGRQDGGGEPDHDIAFHPDDRVLTVTAPLPRWLPLLALRCTRAVARALAVTAGAVPLHGAGVELAGVGLVLVGGKRAGKTTAALSLVRSSGAALVSNDDVLLHASGDRWRMVGGPRSMGVRTDSLEEHRPSLYPAALRFAARSYPANRPDKMFLFPESVIALGGAVRATGPAHVVVELVHRPGGPAWHEELSGAQAAALLRRCLETAADRHRPELVAALGTPAPALSDRDLASLVGSLSFHRFSHPSAGWVDAFLGFARERVGLAGRVR
ncbi:hypothetical protein I3J09_27050 [Streptomyces clavuligerus]|uniref:HPr kinase n=1 Tax=Streptomyces clavuligerus TaxID=1901 RepID=E2Q745_STRCL|nr:hypothetical protein [Streptomyces clavuligerus]ANW21540.1 hypothetical protein BB341_26680 [Streptomyces clavuligerus]AXU16171.1 hypothetical protein D1794_27735 [Streptomyces clavuligerus]EFG05292.1 Hypothetical protein SCLAV_0216 [Streptomyces clavuligerus]MBY6306320.1 hypothetical protein [Streptomyces clavuligerus]QCS08950.1 hypothetical protein CRV15_27100 [Streptomyces clavuligerus]